MRFWKKWTSNKLLDLFKIRVFPPAEGWDKTLEQTVFPIGPNTHNPNDISHPDILRLPYNAQVRFLGVYLTNTELDDNIWNERLTKLKNNLWLWQRSNLSYYGRGIACRAQALGSIMFHSKFNTVPPHIIKSIDTEIKDFIKKGKKKFIISYNTAKLPRTLGGIHAPDINLLVQSSQLTILRNLLDPNNTAEWKHLALNHINNVLD